MRVLSIALPRFGIWELTDVAEEQFVLSVRRHACKLLFACYLPSLAMLYLQGKCHVEGLGLRRFDSIPDAVGRLDYIGLFDRTELNAARLGKLTNCKVDRGYGVVYRRACFVARFFSPERFRNVNSRHIVDRCDGH